VLRETVVRTNVVEDALESRHGDVARTRGTDNVLLETSRNLLSVTVQLEWNDSGERGGVRCHVLARHAVKCDVT
jgi:hypothetical protein